MINNIHNIDKQNPFNVPENYFENFKKDIMLQVSCQENRPEIKTTKKVNLWKKTVAWSTVAAIFLGIIVTFNVSIQNPEQTTSDKSDSHKNIMASTKATDESEFFQYIEEQSMRGVFNETLINDEDIY